MLNFEGTQSTKRMLYILVIDTVLMSIILVDVWRELFLVVLTSEVHFR